MGEEQTRVAWRSWHDWVLPYRAVQTILAVALLFLFLGLVLLAIGGGLGVSGLIATGAVLAGIGGCGLLVCLLLCLHAYFVVNIRDQAVQTSDKPWSDEAMTQEIPGYAVINKPSALKSADGTLRSNGGAMKKVTMAPDVALDADSRAPELRVSGPTQAYVSPVSSNLFPVAASSPGYRTVSSFGGLQETSGGLGKMSGTAMGGSMESFDQRSYAQRQHYQTVTPVATVQQAQLLRQQPESYDIQHQRHQLEQHRQQILQQQAQQQHQFRVQQQPVTVTQRYPVYSMSPDTSFSSSSRSSHQETVIGKGNQQGTASTWGRLGTTGSDAIAAPSSHDFRIQTRGLQYQSGRPYPEDDDYDNPAEGAPMLSPPARQQALAGGKVVSFSGRVKEVEVEIPEPGKLQYPSERRPMTFEQQSSSKMSIYDNVLFPGAQGEV